MPPFGQKPWLRSGVLVALALVLLAMSWGGSSALVNGGAAADAASSTVTAAATLPNGFSDTIALSGLVFPTSVRFSSDGRVFVLEKSGYLKVFDSLSDPTPSIVADFRSQVHDYWDRGALGLALDPNFPATPYVYVLYAYDAPLGKTAPYWSSQCPTPPGPTTDGCPVQGKLVRIQVDANDTMVGAPVELISAGWCDQYPSHAVGDLNFGPDGNLYVTGGEGASFGFVDYGQGGNGTGAQSTSQTPRNPCNDPPAGTGGVMTPPTAEGGALRAQSIRRPSGEPVSLDGALLRINPSTGAAAAGNPDIASPDANAQRIVAYGMRNPFRFTFRPGTSEIWVGDVGEDTWEEINRLTSVSSLVNLGWPCYEGPAPMPGFQAAGLNMCASLYSNPSQVTAPYYAYNHADHIVANDNCSTANGSVISGLSFYSGGSYPTAYNGALFFGDHSRQCIWVMMPGSNGLPDPTNIQTFVSPAGNPVDIERGPNGDLFYVDFEGGSVHRITYQATSCSAGTFHADYFNNMTLSGPPVLSRCENSIDYSWGTGSPDPSVSTDHFSARWSGDFNFATAGPYTFTATTDDGVRVWVDGSPVIDNWQDQSETTVTGTTTLTAGIHTVKVEYYDDANLASAHVGWVAGAPTNQPPVPVIDTPSAALTYAVGDPISFSGHASDPEDGALGAANLSWTLLIHHCTDAGCHIHNVATWNGVSSGSLNAPDHEYPSHLELVLTATDHDGLSATTSVSLQPKTVTLNFQSAPSGMTLAVGASTSVTPFSRTVISNSQNSVSAPTPQTSGGASYQFDSWSDGGAATHNLTAPAAGGTYTATFVPAPAGGGGGAGGTTTTSPTTTAPSPTLDLALSLAGPPQVALNQLAHYTLRLTATGAAAAENAAVTLDVPAGFVVSSVPAACTSSPTAVVCHASALTGGGSAEFTVTLKAVAIGTEHVNAAVAGGGATDPNSGNNRASFVTTVVGAATKPVVHKTVLAPLKPKPGMRLSFSVAIVAAGTNRTLRPAGSTCTVHVGLKSLRTTRVFRDGVLACTALIPSSTRRGTVIRGSLIAVVDSRRVVQRFSSWVR